MAGWIKIHRAIKDSDIYVMPPLYLRVFERLLIEANHQDNEIPFKYFGSDITTKKLIKRGEKLTSIRTICEWIGWFENGIFKKPNPKTVKEILNWLVANGMIAIYENQSNRDGTHYNIVNYNDYQSKEEEEVTVKKQSVNSKETVTGSKQEGIKNVKNVKEVKNIYAEYVSMTLDEYQKLIEKHGQALTNKMIEILDNYKGSKGKTYKSDYRAILSWVEKKVLEEGSNGKPRANDNEIKKFDTSRFINQ